MQTRISITTGTGTAQGEHTSRASAQATALRIANEWRATGSHIVAGNCHAGYTIRRRSSRRTVATITLSATQQATQPQRAGTPCLVTIGGTSAYSVPFSSIARARAYARHHADHYRNEWDPERRAYRYTVTGDDAAGYTICYAHTGEVVATVAIS